MKVDIQSLKPWPDYLSLNRKKNIRDLRNNDCNVMEKSKENQTFHDNAEKVFNKIPLGIREKSYYKIFYNMTKKFFNDKGLKRFMYLGIIVM